MVEEIRYYYREYSNVHQTYCNRKLKTIETFIDEISIIEDIIGFQFYLDDKIAKILLSYEKEFMELNKNKSNIAKQIAIAHKLFRLNMQRLYSVFELSCSDLSESAYNILRTVYETILMMYYLATHSEESEDILMFMNQKFERLKSDVGNNKNDKNRNNDKKKKYTPKYIRDTLYSGDHHESMTKMYSALCIESHPNIHEITGQMETFDLNQIQDLFWYVRVTSFYNVISYIENFSQESKLLEMILTSDLISTIERLKGELVGKDKTMPDFFPDNKSLSEKLSLYRPH